MKRLIPKLLILFVLAACGCNGNETFSFRRSSRPIQTDEKGTPQEDHYTILLSIHRDPLNHIRNANHYQRLLTEQVGWRGLRIIHKAGHSELFWGRYRSPKQAEPNLKTAKAYRAANGMPVFAQAIIVPVPGKDIGAPEWNLKNVSASYSLLVAVFKNDPERNYFGRRRNAVYSCRGLRKKGYEAYFYHDKVVSHVTIGAFGSRSISKRGADGGEIKIKDPAIKKLQAEFSNLIINGNTICDIITDPFTGEKIRLTKKTYMVHIPGKNKGRLRGVRGSQENLFRPERRDRQR